MTGMTTHDHAQAHVKAHVEAHLHTETAQEGDPTRGLRLSALGLSAGARLIGVTALAAALWGGVYWALH